MVRSQWNFPLVLLLLCFTSNAMGQEANKIFDASKDTGCAPTCDVDKCATPENCIAGEVMDTCGCCKVCGRTEGQRCDNTSLALPYRQENGPCGEGLLCLMRDDLRPKELPEALCVCADREMVCGSDGVSYDSMCQLHETVQRRGAKDGLHLRYKGPCKTAPWIVSAPESTSAGVHQRVALDCEAKGHPTPLVRWEFTSTDGIATKTLPSDNILMAVQLRGGPEHYMVTSWLQLMDLTVQDQGNYTCIASNSEGDARASAALYVFEGN